MSYDPIEDAKMQSPGAARKQRPQPAVKVDAPLVDPPAPVVGAMRRYRAKNERAVSINGSMTYVAVGQIIDPLGYSAVSIDAIRRAGVELEEI